MSAELFTKLGPGGIVLPRDAGDALIIRHNPSGRIYMPSSSAERLGWDGALAYVADLNKKAYADRTNWVIAPQRALLDVLDYEQDGSYVHPVFGGRVKPRFHWSSSVFAGVRVCQWGVLFGDGGTGVYHRRYDSGYVLAVCDGVPASPGQ